MFGMRNEARDFSAIVERRVVPEFRFNSPDTSIFLTGVPLSGKSTIAPIISSSIEGCLTQSMDIIRLIAQRMDEAKPVAKRNPFVRFGSCDSYLFVGDGSYSEQSLVEGYNSYSSAVFSVLGDIVPKMEVQGVQNVLFEGVQLAPSLVAPYL